VRVANKSKDPAMIASGHSVHTIKHVHDALRKRHKRKEKKKEREEMFSYPDPRRDALSASASPK